MRPLAAALLALVACARPSAPVPRVVATFRGQVDPATGQLAFLAPDGTPRPSLLVTLPEGAPGSGTPDTVELSNAAAPAIETACGGKRVFRGTVRVKSNFASATLQHVYAELLTLSASGREACNSAAPVAGVSDQFGLFSYGALGKAGTPEASADQVWLFPTPDDTAYSFTGRVVADVVPLAGTNHPASGGWSPVGEAGWAAASWPLGATFTAGEGSTLRVGVWSARATKMVLEVYDQATGADALHDYDLAQGADGVWRGAVALVPGKALYAVRAWGPNWPWVTTWARGHSSAGFLSDVDGAGNRFNPNKVLHDPYARELSHDLTGTALLAAGDDATVYGTGGANVSSTQVYSGPLAGGAPRDRRDLDTGRFAPKGIALEDATATGTHPRLPQQDLAIYEAHVKGLSAHPSAANLATLLTGLDFPHAQSVPDALRGTYAGAGLLAGYLKDLGYTAVELLPIHETDNDANATTHSGGNYWGYQTFGFFAPDRHWAHDQTPGGPTREFKQMVKAFHDAGLEVLLDVVYNHTGEGGTWDSTAAAATLSSFRGLDNAGYYALTGGGLWYWEATGCGNMLDASQAQVRTLVNDSLAYWAGEMGVDGFRFDIAPVLGRTGAANSFAYSASAPLLASIATNAASGDYKVIAEPWDTQAAHLGEFPAGWAEWNGGFRDALRSYIRGEATIQLGVGYADAFNGDYGHFNAAGGPHKSVNMIDAHDGFTLADIVSYDTKTNLSRAWPFGPSDGGIDNNLSSSWGGDKKVRRTNVRNFLAFQLFGRGVPMQVWGDELGRTQNGNNNAYQVDSVATWNNYAMAATSSPQLVPTGDTSGGSEAAYHDNLGTFAGGQNQNLRFLQSLLRLRQAHPALRRTDYSMSITFTKNDGTGGFSQTTDLAVRALIGGSTVGDTDFLFMGNMWRGGSVPFTVPAPSSGHWVRVVDTQDFFEADANAWTCATGATISGSYGVAPGTIVVLQICP